MKKLLFVVALALCLTFAFASGAFATTYKGFTASTSYYKWTGGSQAQDTWSGVVRVYVNGSIPGTTTPARLPYDLEKVGDNPANPGAHANYLATTAKCGMCHSVHRAAGDGTKLLPTSDPTCAACHTGGTAITAKIITWGVLNMNWRADITTSTFSYGGAGPHNDTLKTFYEDGEWDGLSTPPLPSFSTEPFERYGCWTRRCHATNPHGANSSKYKIFAAKLLFNDTPAQDGGGTYGGLDAVWDGMGATDAAVERFVSANSSIVSTTAGGDILLNGAPLDAAETHALVAGLTCGRPSNAGAGEDECHAEASYAIVDKRIKEQRNHGTGALSPNAIRTDNAGSEALGFGGNDNRDWKTAHVAGSFDATPGAGSYSPIAGCTSCHDQTDKANTVAGNFTFPHGQTAAGDTNIYLANDGGATMATGVRVRIWSGFAGNNDAKLLTFKDSAAADFSYANQKAFDGQCLKCHRDSDTVGIGKTQ